MKREHITRRHFIQRGTLMGAGLVLYTIDAEAPVRAVSASDELALWKAWKTAKG